MVKFKILDICSFPDEAFNNFFGKLVDKNTFELIRAGPKASEDRVCELVKDADFLLTDSLHFTPVTRRVIESGKKLKLIQCYTIGFDDVDLVAAKERGIPVANSAGITARPMAEYTIMAALFLIKSIEYANTETRKGNWVQQQLIAPERMPLEFGSLTLGIIGCGSIGREIARLAKEFGTQIQYNNRNRLSPEVEKELTITYKSFEEIIRTSDVLSINVPLTKQTRGMIGEKEIRMMKRGSVLINTARGEVVDVDALAEALKTGHLRGAAVDVFVNEPKIEGCPLLGAKNVLLTPHSSALSPEIMKRVPPLVFENLYRVCEGKPPLRVVN